MFVDCAALCRHIVPNSRQRGVKARAAVDNQELGLAQPSLDQIIKNRPPGLFGFSAKIFTASNTFCPSSRTPSTTKSEIKVALRSSRTRTTVPSRINRTIGSSASERVFQAFQSLSTFRHTRLTVSLLTDPRKSVASARRTRRVFVPD